MHLRPTFWCYFIIVKATLVLIFLRKFFSKPLVIRRLKLTKTMITVLPFAAHSSWSQIQKFKPLTAFRECADTLISNTRTATYIQRPGNSKKSSVTIYHKHKIYSIHDGFSQLHANAWFYGWDWVPVVSRHAMSRATMAKCFPPNLEHTPTFIKASCHFPPKTENWMMCFQICVHCRPYK